MRNVIPMLTAISKKIFNSFKNDFKDLAMDEKDVFQEAYIYYMDFEKNFKNKFKENILWSAIRQYVIWKTMEKIYNWKKRKVDIISLDTELQAENDTSKENEIHELILKGREDEVDRFSPLIDKKELMKIILKSNPDFNLENIKKILGNKKYILFMKVLEGKNTLEKIGGKHKMSKQAVEQKYNRSIKKLQKRFIEDKSLTERSHRAKAN